MKNDLLTLAFIAPGSVGHTIKWVNGLAEKGVIVTLITQHKVLVDVDNRVKVIYLPYQGKKGYFLNAFALNRIIKKISPKVINVHYASGYGVLALLSRIKPYILSVWGSDVYDFPFSSKFNFWLIKKSLLNAGKVASTSHAMADQVQTVLKPLHCNIAITPFGVDFSKFKKSSEPFSNNVITIGIVKKLEFIYGVDLLIKAFAIALNQLSDKDNCKFLKLVIVGEGSLKGELEALSHELGISDYVDFVGAVSNDIVPQYINKIDVFVVPSRIESFGVAVIEALGCERPCIVSNTGGLPEVVEHLKTGLVVDCESESAIAEAILTLIHNRNMAINMGSSGRKDVLDKYANEYVIINMIDVYRKFYLNNEQ